MTEDIRKGIRATLIGLLGNLILAGIKLMAGLSGGSAALVADAVESLADGVSSVIVLGGLTISARPPDSTHPYGHGKAEPMATLAVSVILLIAAVGVVLRAVTEMGRSARAPAAYTLYVLIGVVVVKEALYRICRRVGLRLGSTAIDADAWHHRSDAITSLIAAVGISITLLGGPDYAVADAWAAILAAGVIGFNAIRFMNLATHELMDALPAEGFVAGIAGIAGGVAGVRGVERILARKMGTGYWVDMHVEVDGTLSVDEAHDLAHRVKDAIRAEDLRVTDVLIHIEPFHSAHR
jgi:cation diffusion facilitator family transporter